VTDSPADRVYAALAQLTTGIYVLTARDGAIRHGMSSSWVTQVSGTPPLLMAAVDIGHATHALIAASGDFALNVIGTRGRHLEDYFFSAASRRPDNLSNVDCQPSPRGLPYLCAAALSLECRVIDRHAAGDHSLFIAEISDAVLRDADRPLTSLDLEYVYVGTVVPRTT
jgi:flavin reductase (DIM6/NTAB) family NADH-FMN oxidoreductase RutF